jgi:HlyD family secretion protein
VTNPRPEDIAAAQSQLASAQSKLDQLQHPRPEDIKNAEAGLVSARAKLAQTQNPRPEDVAAAQAQLDQARTKLAQLNDLPNTAAVQDIANAELAVQKAQVAYDKALADASANSSPAVGSAAAPRGTSAATSAAATQADNAASVAQALLDLQTAQNTLGKLKAQSPTAWDVRQQQEALQQAQANLDKVQHPTQYDVQQAQAAVDQAQVALDKLKNPSPYDVQQAQEAVNQAQANLDKLNNPAPSDVQAAQQAVVQAQAGLDKLANPSAYDVQAAQQAVVQAQAGLDKLLVANRYDLQTAQAALDQAQANLALKQAGNTDLDVAIAQAAVDQAKGALDQAKANLDGATLTAPYSGVVAATGANPGEQVGTGTALVTLVDTRQVRVDVVVDETDVAKVQPGQPVSITMDALPGQRLPGTVSVIAPTGTVTQGVVNYTVQIQVDPAQAQGARPGMTATAAITTASKDNALVVPNRAVRTQGRAKTVDVLDADGKTTTRPVQTGLANDQVTEVLSGLQPGDRVVIPTTTTAAARVPGFGGPGGPGGGPGGGPVFVRG